MKLYECKGEYEALNEPILPDFFFVQSSSAQVNNSFVTLQGNHGQMPVSTKGRIAPRTFSITGNVESETSSKVEKLRGELFSKMYGKILWLRVNDDDERMFRVMLDGGVSVTYHSGSVISRVFTFSFTLKAYEGVCWGVKTESISQDIFFDSNGQSYGFSRYINYVGDISVMPLIEMHLTRDNFASYTNFVIRRTFMVNDKDFIKLGERVLNLGDDAIIGGRFIVKDGMGYNADRICKEIDKKCLAVPLILTKGNQRLDIDFLQISLLASYPEPPIMRVQVKWRACYY